ncbi:MAG: hypothetical protein R2797_05620 [Gelidibacter sp.]
MGVILNEASSNGVTDITMSSWAVQTSPKIASTPSAINVYVPGAVTVSVGFVSPGIVTPLSCHSNVVKLPLEDGFIVKEVPSQIVSSSPKST